jgi:hypothetical protein
MRWSRSYGGRKWCFRFAQVVSSFTPAIFRSSPRMSSCHEVDEGFGKQQLHLLHDGLGVVLRTILAEKPVRHPPPTRSVIDRRRSDTCCRRAGPRNVLTICAACKTTPLSCFELRLSPLASSSEERYRGSLSMWTLLRQIAITCSTE